MPGLGAALLPDDGPRRADLHRPRGAVRGGAARAEPRLGPRVGPGRERLVEPDNHVEQEVSERTDPHAAEPTIPPWTRTAGAAASGRSSSAGSWARRPRSRPA